MTSPREESRCVDPRHPRIKSTQDPREWTQTSRGASTSHPDATATIRPSSQPLVSARAEAPRKEDDGREGDVELGGDADTWSRGGAPRAPRVRLRDREPPRGARHPAEAAFPRGDRGRLLRPRLLLDRRAGLLAGRRRLHDRGRLHERDDAESDRRRGGIREDRPCRDGAGRLRPGRDLLRGAAEGLPRGRRSDPGDAPARKSAPTPGRASTSATRPNG
jgi:hypothetical protein